MNTYDRIREALIEQFELNDEEAIECIDNAAERTMDHPEQTPGFNLAHEVYGTLRGSARHIGLDEAISECGEIIANVSA